MHEVLTIDDFLARSSQWPVIDVRTPAEFSDGHIPGALNIPLFSNDERAEIGTLYAREGRQAAVLRGLARVGPRLESLAASLSGAAGGDGRLLVHCWRGGMRSASMAWLAGTVGCRAATLAGGYKSFRRKVLAKFEDEIEIGVVAGLTGTGKTEVLRELRRRGAQVIDLEALAHHKGSAFGDLGEEPQPTQEQFENDLASVMFALDPARPVWMEDESQTVGRLVVPPVLWRRKRAGRFHRIELPLTERIAHLCRVYGGFPAEQLARRIDQIRRRLGGDRANQALAALHAGDLAGVCRTLFSYYDRTYGDSMAALPAERVTVHSFEAFDACRIAESLLCSPLSSKSLNHESSCPTHAV